MKMKNNNELGYIYIYKCVVGSGSDVCKIGITKDYHRRLKQHVRTPYYGFIPYIEFTTGNPIATVFKIRDYNFSDELINRIFRDFQFGNFEIYTIDYDEAIKRLYEELKSANRLVELIKDNYSAYGFLDKENSDENVKTDRDSFKEIRDKIVSKYNDSLPEDLLIMLRNKDEFKKNCNSHYSRGNYVDFPNNMILDLNYNKEKRVEMLNKLRKFV